MHEVLCNGVMIVRTPTGIGVACISTGDEPARLLAVEVDCDGFRLKNEVIDSHGPPWRDYYAGVDMMRCVVRVRDGERTLAELSLPDEEYPLPFMVPRPEQVHVTEHYVSVPPALTITDERGDVWTLGFATAPKHRSPDGEFAFEVLRNGVGQGEIASRIERRGSKIRIFTHVGWKRQSESGREFL